MQEEYAEHVAAAGVKLSDDEEEKWGPFFRTVFGKQLRVAIC